MSSVLDIRVCLNSRALTYSLMISKQEGCRKTYAHTLLKSGFPSRPIKGVICRKAPQISCRQWMGSVGLAAILYGYGSKWVETGMLFISRTISKLGKGLAPGEGEEVAGNRLSLQSGAIWSEAQFCIFYLIFWLFFCVRQLEMGQQWTNMQVK